MKTFRKRQETPIGAAAPPPPQWPAFSGGAVMSILVIRRRKSIQADSGLLGPYKVDRGSIFAMGSHPEIAPSGQGCGQNHLQKKGRLNQHDLREETPFPCLNVFGAGDQCHLPRETLEGRVKRSSRRLQPQTCRIAANLHSPFLAGPAEAGLTCS